MEVNEKELIEQVINGSRSAMESIFNMYVTSSVKLAYLITEEWSGAEDAVQEAFIRAFQHIKSFDKSKNFKPWFTKIVVNEARRVKKTSCRETNLDTMVYMKNEDALIEDVVIEEISNKALMKQIYKLDLKYRLPITLKYFHGLSEKEISKVLFIPVTTVKARLYKARQKLKKDYLAVEGEIIYG